MPSGRDVEMELEIARRLAVTTSSIGVLDPRVEPRVYKHRGRDVTLWTYYEPLVEDVAAAQYANALRELHTGMRALDVATANFMDRVEGAQRLVADRDDTPELDIDDRALLHDTLRDLRDAIGNSGAPEQLIHGEPHIGNVLNTTEGPVFIDLETCCRGPVEFDVAHAPTEIGDHYPGLDRDLLQSCRQLVLAMVAVWRFAKGDEFPNGLAVGRALVQLLSAGPPWPALGDLRMLA
jgi:aminoglycoside phosphotransferase (APT) family kinase protein